MDFHFAHRQGNGTQVQAMRVQLEVSTLPISRSSQTSQQAAKPFSMAQDKELDEKPNDVEGDKPELRQAQSRYQVASEVAAAVGEQQDRRLRYIETLLRQIESKKYYPSSARRRGIQGRIEVNFTLYDADDIRHVRLIGDSELLKRVSREALEAALPFAPPPEGVMLPLAVHYLMDYSLH